MPPETRQIAKARFLSVMIINSFAEKFRQRLAQNKQNQTKQKVKNRSIKRFRRLDRICLFAEPKQN
jgi:hypothetical protein